VTFYIINVADIYNGTLACVFLAALAGAFAWFVMKGPK